MDKFEDHRWGEICRLLIAAGFFPDNSKAEMMKLNNKLNQAVKAGLMAHDSEGHWSVNVTALRATGKLDYAEKKLKKSNVLKEEIAVHGRVLSLEETELN